MTIGDVLQVFVEGNEFYEQSGVQLSLIVILPHVTKASHFNCINTQALIIMKHFEQIIIMKICKAHEGKNGDNKLFEYSGPCL